MEIANGIVRLGKQTEIAKYNMTPAEAVICFKLHEGNAKGNPLADGGGQSTFTVQPGQAMQQVGSKRAKAMRSGPDGDEVEVDISIPTLRERTMEEEIQRLKKTYIGSIRVPGQKASVPILEACFPGVVKNLPETFEEVERGLNLPRGFFKREHAEEGYQPIGEETPRKSRRQQRELAAA